MKKSIFMSLIALLMLSVSGYAQNEIKVKDANEVKKNRKEKIFNKKLEFFKKHLKLTGEESENFEKAYRQYVDKKLSLRKAYNTEIYQKIKIGNLEELSEEDKQKIISRKLDLDKQTYELNAAFTKKLTGILPPEKVIRYFILERKFNRKLMTRIKKRREMLHNRRKEMIRRRNEKRENR